jgi:hypothetical protein
MQLHAQAVEGVTKKYQLDSGSPGFIEYVLPEIAQAQQKLFDLHATNVSNNMKETAWRQALLRQLASTPRHGKPAWSSGKSLTR